MARSTGCTPRVRTASAWREQAMTARKLSSRSLVAGPAGIEGVTGDNAFATGARVTTDQRITDRIEATRDNAFATGAHVATDEKRHPPRFDESPEITPSLPALASLRSRGIITRIEGVTGNDDFATDTRGYCL